RRHRFDLRTDWRIPDALHLLLRVGETFEDERLDQHVGKQSVQTVFQLRAEPRHHTVDDDERGHPQHNADDARQRQIAADQVAPAEHKLIHDLSSWTSQKGAPYFFSGRKSGNRITSRIDCALVSSILKRSIPMPIPPAAGMP